MIARDPAKLRANEVNQEERGMKKTPAFNEAKPRAPKDEARQREIKAMRAMEELVDLGDEDEYKRRLAERFGILPGHPRYQKAMATWRELRRGKP
jgi:hypothetical protein